MTPEQAAAFIHAQSVSAYAEIEGMKSTNRREEMNGEFPKHNAGAFSLVITEHGLTYNQLVEFFRSVNG